jgi:hypothetical protein
MLNSHSYNEMNKLALEAGTDKSSAGHNYTRVYSMYLDSLRDKPINFLEIGIQEGYSALFWENYFPHANLHFIDITNEKLKYHSSRSSYHYLDQENKAELNKFLNMTQVGFDVVIDDGGHTMRQQINSFEAIFPFLNSGGIYIIEDLHTSYWQSHGGHGSVKKPLAGKGTTMEFLQNLIHDINFLGASTGKANREYATSQYLSSFNIYQDKILSIHFYDSLALIFKR